MKVSFLTAFRFFQLPNGELYSAGASARYRVLLPAKVLAEYEYKSAIITLSDEVLRNPHAAAAKIDADIAVISKFFDPRTVDLVSELQRRKVKIVADFCDNHFLTPELRQAYLALVAQADGIACNSKAMAEEIREQTGREATVVCDPVEGHKGDARFDLKKEGIRCVSYGYPPAINFLFRELEGWMKDSVFQSIQIVAVTTPVPDLIRRAETISRALGGRCKVELVDWSPSAVPNAIAFADLILLPSDISPVTKTKSANRLIEAIYGGRLAIASSLPSYIELADYFILENDKAAIRELFALEFDPARALKMILEGQKYIQNHYLPIHAAREWDKLFKSVRNAI